MDKHEYYESGEWRATTREGCPIAGLIVVLALVFITYFSLRLAMPELPLRVYQALAFLPS